MCENKSEKDCKIIFVGNYKGGVGKTTTVIYFANYLCELDKKVLTIDLDPQSSLSEIQARKIDGVGTLSALNEDKDKYKECLNYVLDLSIKKIKKYPSIDLFFDKEKIIKTVKSNGHEYDCILSSLFYREELGGLGLDSLAMMMENNIEYLSILKSYVDTIKEDYDYILIDCPPSNTLLTQSAFLMSDYYLIPTICDGISNNGVIHYIKTVDKIYNDVCVNGEDAIFAKHYFKNKPQLLGVFFNKIRHASYALEKLNFRDALLKSGLPDSKLIDDVDISDYVDTARQVAVGETYDKELVKFNKLFDIVLEKIEQFEGNKND